ncbi:MAG: hypothetical protein ACTSUP_09685 [Candidatus Heimdallarchaeaceae archaeon]
MERPKTIFCDIDGVIFYYPDRNVAQQHLGRPKVLPGIREAFADWDLKGYRIILVTGRREGVRKHTEKQLVEAGIFYDHLIMGLGGGTRIMINDYKPDDKKDTAVAINVERNKGLKDITNV